MLVISLLLIIVFLGILVFYSFKGVNILFLAPIVSVLLVISSTIAYLIFGGSLPKEGSESSFFLASLTGPFMSSIVGYITPMFLVFLVGAIYGTIIDSSGASVVIGKWIVKIFGKNMVIPAIITATSLLTYGGVSLFVVVFAMYPIAVSLFKQIDIPKRLMPGAIATGAFTFTMNAMPGSPQSLNVLPTNKLGTDIYAAPILGLFASAVMFFGAILWMTYRENQLKSKGEGYGEHTERETQGSKRVKVDEENLPSIVASLTPIILVFVLNFVFTNVIFKNKDLLTKMSITKVDGQWTVILSLTIAIIISLVIYKKQIKNPIGVLNQGANDAILPLFNTAAIIGFGGVVKSMSMFPAIKGLITGLSLPGIWKVAISTTLLAGIVGSSSGGTGLALEALGDEFLKYIASGLPAQVIHRIMIIASGGLDSLPHCGAVVTLLMVTKLTHKESYTDIAIVTMAIPLLSVILTILLYQMTGLV